MSAGTSDRKAVRDSNVCECPLGIRNSYLRPLPRITNFGYRALARRQAWIVRRQAQAAGNLKSDGKQVVQVEKEVITIVPADPQVIYVPQYNPATVVAPVPDAPPDTDPLQDPNNAGAMLTFDITPDGKQSLFMDRSGYTGYDVWRVGFIRERVRPGLCGQSRRANRSAAQRQK